MKRGLVTCVHHCEKKRRISEKGITIHAYDAHIEREIQKEFHLSDFLYL